MATWVQASRDGGFPHRDTARVFQYKNRLFLSGGYQYGGAALQDLWYSGDGANWHELLSTTPYPEYTPVAVHDDKVFAVGSDKVRSSTDLVNWTTALDPTPFSDNLIEAPLVGDFDGKMWLILADKIRYSTDGVTWNVAAVPWAGSLVNFSAIKHDGYLYVFAGAFGMSDVLPEKGYANKTSVNKVWRTADPINGPWDEFDAPWGARLWPQAVSLNGSIYVVSGYSNIANVNYDDVWKVNADIEGEPIATDALYLTPPGWTLSSGDTWNGKYLPMEVTNLSYTPRHWPAAFGFNGALWICGGNRNPNSAQTVSDCWYLRED